MSDQNSSNEAKTPLATNSVEKDSSLIPDPAEAERIRIIAYLSYDTVYSDDFCLRCSHCPSNCECKSPVYMDADWTPSSQLKALKFALFQEKLPRVAIGVPTLLDALNRLKSKNGNPDRDWYLGWNSAIDCLINDINARTKPITQAGAPDSAPTTKDQD